MSSDWQLLLTAFVSRGLTPGFIIVLEVAVWCLSSDLN